MRRWILIALAATFGFYGCGKAKTSGTDAETDGETGTATNSDTNAATNADTSTATDSGTDTTVQPPSATPDDQATLAEVNLLGMQYAPNVCTPLFVQRLSASKYPSFADHDITVQFTLTYFMNDSATSVAFYSDETCSTKSSGDITGSGSPITADYTLRAGDTAVAAYIMATPPATAPAEDYILKATFQSAQVATDDTYKLGYPSVTYDPAETSLIKDIAFGPTTPTTEGAQSSLPLVVETCTLAGVSVTPNAGVESQDVAFDLAVDDPKVAKLYADPGCTQEITTATIRAGSGWTAVFVKATGAGTFKVTLNAPAIDLANAFTFFQNTMTHP